MQNDIFLKACFRQRTSRTPVWIMRQAGRYLPEYRAVRAQVDFLTLCKTPELAARVTIQPIDALGVDAAILFSDILVVPEAMGMQLVVEEGKGGPRFPNPVRTAQDIAALCLPDPSEKLGYVMDAIRLTRKELRNRVPLIGFSGSPWTLATYMVEGCGSRDFKVIKHLLYGNPDLLHRLLEKLAQSVTGYIKAQIEAGAQAIQIFDTWGGVLSPDDFREFSLRYIEQILHAVKSPGIPLIVYCKGAFHSVKKIASTGADVIGVDWMADIGEVRDAIEAKTALQGNLDPALLFSSPDRIRGEVKNILEKFGKGSGHIFNLGHGIFPDTPVENAKAFVDAVKEESVPYHQ